MPTARRTRIPAFGEWNHHHHSNGGGAWAPAVMTPSFDFGHAITTPHKAPQTVCTYVRARVIQSKAHNDASACCLSTRRMGSNARRVARACVQQGRRRGAADGVVHAAKLAAAAAAAEPHQGHTQTTRRSKVADSGAYAQAAAAARRSCFALAKPVDDDLYGVPPDMLYGKPPPPGARKDDGWRRILRLLGCSCLS
ncbi:uncharacterized protein [Zea mays]|uniref:uncharacterized protein isoform X2 n=1 Tax=Zea mays TaxID=4577 RepID=UPI000221B487|nr:uncharacterized protein LOC100193956 isoform X2 [Zea mays]|eukprot:XP_020400484.1 uncharacterized protein LOC100193956 isoform X2 [Zea mays]